MIALLKGIGITSLAISIILIYVYGKIELASYCWAFTAGVYICVIYLLESKIEELTKGP